MFYDYADALRYAYSPQAWFSGHFDLNNAFGISATDHANRGPAYIVVAYPSVSLLKLLGLDTASAWHLVNFLTFQLGVYLLYRLSARWMSKPAALAAAALFAWQPLLWGHAFINPKDMPFLVFFIGAMCFGFEMVDDSATQRKQILKALAAGFFLGIATSIRVLGPLAGVLIGLYALSKFKKTSPSALIKILAMYAAVTVIVVIAAWPYLWTSPIQKFIEAFGFMSGNPTELPVLFGGKIYLAYELPRRYLPVLLSLTLTEPVFPLFFIGLFLALVSKKQDDRWRLIFDYALIFLWLAIPLAYVLLRKPPMYDGYRHFLFMIPPLFIFAGFVFEKIFELLKPRWAAIALAAILLLPGVYASIQLFPYEYAYYNSFAGGTGGAFRTYETEYWLTCYKEAVEKFNEPGAQLFVKREPYIADYYENKNITIRDYRAEFGKIQSGDYVLVNTRTNEDIKTFRDAPIVLQVSRAGAIFCEVKRVP